MSSPSRDTRPARWVTVSEAVRLLGKTERTIRRWIDAGAIPVDTTITPLRVDVAGRLPAQEPAPDTTPDMALLRETIRHLEAELAERTGERDYLRQALAQALTLQRPALEAPRRPWRWPWQRE